MQIVTVVLAAGMGRRMGGPKALLAWPRPVAAGLPSAAAGEREPLAIAHARARLAAESERVWIVARAEVVAALEPWVDDTRIRLLISNEPDDLGPAGSLAVASRALSLQRAESLVVVAPVDLPPARAETVIALCRAASISPAVRAVRPRSSGRRGHPVVIRGDVLLRYREPDPPPLRVVLAGLGAHVVDVEVGDDGVVADLDTVAAWAASFVAAGGRLDSSDDAARFVADGGRALQRAPDEKGWPPDGEA